MSTPRRTVARPRIAAALTGLMLLTACGTPAHESPAGQLPGEIRIGAVFPTKGSAAALAKEQLLGTQIAADFVNSDGGVDGRRIVLDVRDLERAEDARAVMRSLRDAGANVVIGAYASDLSVAASHAADTAGLVYWEAGAVADRLTGRGLPRVFRVGASGANLGSNSGAFAATQLAPRLGKAPRALRVAIVNADDEYARSVADAAASAAARAGVTNVFRQSYSLTVPDWAALMSELGTNNADVIILASHIPDGIAFRRAMVAARLRVGALIGSTMAECSPDFAGDLGVHAIGVFASDRPTGGFQSGALSGSASAIYERLAAEWLKRAPSTRPANDGYSNRYAKPGDAEPGAAEPGAAERRGAERRGAEPESEYTIEGPIEEHSPAAGPTEEGLSGFTAAWVLFDDVLPAAFATAAPDAPDVDDVATAARALDLPAGALPNGAGVRFSTEPQTLGQNERAAAVIWQWQAVRSYTFVWPPTYATGSIQFVPLDE